MHLLEHWHAYKQCWIAFGGKSLARLAQQIFKKNPRFLTDPWHITGSKLCGDMCADTHVDTHSSMRIGSGVGMGLDICTDVCMGHAGCAGWLEAARPAQ